MQRRTLSLKRLVDLGACSPQRQLFEKHFGKSVRVTPGLCVRVALLFNWRWAARNLLSRSALAEYRRVCDLALAEYNRAHDAAWDEYTRAHDPAWAEYNRARARIFGELYNKDA